MLDLSRWAVVSHKDDTGLGRQAEDFKNVMGVRRHIAIPSERMVDKPLHPPYEVMLRPEDPVERVREVLDGLQAIIFFERPGWHPQLLPIAREMGVWTVCVPNWEWFKGHDPLWQHCDLFACPSQWTLGVVESFGWRNALHLTWTVDVRRFSPRTIAGPARVFIHNAGLVDADDRKGTRNTIEAFKRVRGDDLRLIVRMQKEAELPALDKRIEVRVGNLDDPAALYVEGEVAVQPSKMEGIGFMVLEPMCCGIPVITTRHPPMSEYIAESQLLVSTRWGKRKALASNWVKQAYLKIPQTRDLAARMQWCSENDLGELSLKMRRRADELFDPIHLRPRWSQSLTEFFLNLQK